MAKSINRLLYGYPKIELRSADRQAVQSLIDAHNNNPSAHPSIYKYIEDTRPIIGPFPPSSPVKGQIWFDLSTNSLKQWDGSSWVPVSMANAANSDLLDGLDSTQFLRSDTGEIIVTNTQTTTGPTDRPETYGLKTLGFTGPGTAQPIVLFARVNPTAREGFIGSLFVNSGGDGTTLVTGDMGIMQILTSPPGSTAQLNLFSTSPDWEIVQVFGYLGFDWYGVILTNPVPPNTPVVAHGIFYSDPVLIPDASTVTYGGISTYGQWYSNGGIVWNSKNDGQNSGLDADLVRGLPADFKNSVGTSGYQNLPSGLIIQWGRVFTSGQSNGTVLFPIAFPNQVFTVVATQDETGAGVNAKGVVIYNLTNSGFSYQGVGGRDSEYINWVALGN